MSTGDSLVLFVLDLHIKYTVDIVHLVYCVVYCHVIATQCVKSVECVFALIYALVDDLECHWTMNELFLFLIYLIFNFSLLHKSAFLTLDIK